jgi:hypothetical protein
MSGDDMVGLFSNAKSIWRHCVDLWQICWCDRELGYVTGCITWTSMKWKMRFSWEG